jgi:putative transposon-encoded protein
MESKEVKLVGTSRIIRVPRYSVGQKVFIIDEKEAAFFLEMKAKFTVD